MKKKVLYLAVSLMMSSFAQAAEQTAQSELTGEIAASCTVSATNADFGTVTQAQAGTTVSVTPQLTINCSNGAGYSYFVDASPSYELKKNTDVFTGAPPTTGVGTIDANSELVLANGADPLGVLKFWSNSAKTVAMPTAANVLTSAGTGADQIIPLAVDWQIPSAGALTGGSYGSFKVVNTYKVIF